jgi:hypothetical protein
MRKLCLVCTAALAVVGAMIGERSHAAIVDPNALQEAADDLTAVELVQFSWRGRRYCWYNTGWRGPGWYRCGFRWRRGLGWGGPLGWHGWRRPGIHRPGRPGNRPGINRPGGNRPGINRPGGNRPGINRPGANRPGANRPGNRPGGNRPGNRPDRNRAGTAADAIVAAARAGFAIREAPMAARLDARVPHEVFYIQNSPQRPFSHTAS